MGVNMYAWVYILKCADETLYTGYTTDINRRIYEHNSCDAKCKYTAVKSRQPVKLQALWKVELPKNNAMKVEYFIKSLKRNIKLELIKNPLKLTELYIRKKGKLEFEIDIDTLKTSYKEDL